jgi:hypothetical protein
MATDPRYMSFDHQYVETVESTSVIAAHRFVTRAGAYASANGYAAGVSVYDAYGPGQLTAKGYQVDDGSTLVYEGQLNPSTTPAKVGVFPYQGLLSIVTSGIAIVEVDSAAAAISVDEAICVGADGKGIDQASAGAGATVAGRALDAVGAGAGGYIRVKLGNEAGA